MEADKKLFKNLAVSNSELVNDIQQLASSTSQQNRESDIATKGLLLRLYNSIVRLVGRRGHPPAPNKTIIEAYHSFLEPIKTLAGLPMGDFLTARMFLYLSSALIHDKSLNLRFSESKAPAASAFLHEFCIDLDDGLLDPLKRIWVKDNHEQFNWVFSEAPVKHSVGSGIDPASHPDLAQALSPEELTAAAGGRGRQWFWSKHTGELVWSPWSTRPPDVCDEDTEDVLWKCIGTDGPICSGRVYRTADRNVGEESLHAVPVLRRSRQFILDARQISKPFITKQGRHLLEVALFRARIPTEIREMIWAYMREPPPPERPSYLTDLDLAAAYTPFPRAAEPCQECKKRTRRRDKGLKETCPEKTIYVWNLPLRLFHVLHQAGKTGWRPCKEGLECSGHHDDDEWRLKDEEQLVNWVDEVNMERNDNFTELIHTDYGTADSIVVSLKEDEARRKRLFSENGPFEGAAEQRKMKGGLRNPLDVMAHNAAVLGAWREGQENGLVTEKVQWALGRNLVEQAKAEDAMRRLLHVGVRHCWFCQGRAPGSQVVRRRFPPLMATSSESDWDSGSDSDWE